MGYTIRYDDYGRPINADPIENAAIVTDDILNGNMTDPDRLYKAGKDTVVGAAIGEVFGLWDIF